MIVNDIGINKQNYDENKEKWGDILNLNEDRYEDLIKALIMASTVNRNVLHVFPTDDAGSPILETYIKQMAETPSNPGLQGIINNIVGNDDVSYPLTGNNIVYWGVLKNALEYIVGLDDGKQYLVILHPGKHVVTDDLDIPTNCAIIGASKSITEVALSSANIVAKKNNLSLRNLHITGTGYILYDATDDTIDDNELINSKVDVPIYIDSYNRLSPIDLYVKGSEINGDLVFVNSFTGASNIQLGTIAFVSCFIGKNSVYVSDEVDGAKTAATLLTQAARSLTDLISEEQALTDDVKTGLVEVDYSAFKAVLASLDNANYHLAGTHAAVALASPYPIMRYNTYI